MDYKKSSLLYKKRANSSNIIFQYKFSNNYVNKDQRKSKEININFSQRFKEIKNSNLNKSPINQRLSLQNTNMLSFSKILKNKNTYIEKLPQKRDKNYYLNILNEIYLSDPHLSNKNKIIKCDKDNPYKFSRFNSSKNISFKFGSKNINKKYSLCSNELRKKSHKKRKRLLMGNT